MIFYKSKISLASFFSSSIFNRKPAVFQLACRAIGSVPPVRALSPYMQVSPTQTDSNLLPVYQGEGGLTAAVNNALTNRSLLDAVDEDNPISL
jgi:hypothetical protein